MTGVQTCALPISLADARSNASGIAKQTRDKLAAETEAEKAKVDGQVAAKLREADARIAATKTLYFWKSARGKRPTTRRTTPTSICTR